MDATKVEQRPSKPRPDRVTCEVLVIGAGPSGSSAAYWLTDAGYDVIVVEKKSFPREKTCGDGLTPRSVRQLNDMGLADSLSGHHRYDGLRAMAFGKELTLAWPEHPDFPNYGYVVTRADLDAHVANRAEEAGAVVWYGVEAISSLEGGNGSNGNKPLDSTGKKDPALLKGAIVRDLYANQTIEITASYVIVADGASSRFGRTIGGSRDRSLPFGLAIRGYFSSPRSAETLIESHLDIADGDGGAVPGYGWIFPLGDGRVNVGIGILSTLARWKEINTTKLMSTFVDFAPDSWELSPETAIGSPTGGKLPMGFSVGPRSGLDYLVVGDAAGAINPFNGEGIAYGYETGRLAAAVIGEALASGNQRALFEYENLLDERYGLYYKVARIFVQLMGKPELLRALVNTGMRSQTIMEWLLKIMANLLNPDEIGPAEAAYRAAEVLVRSVR